MKILIYGHQIKDENEFIYVSTLFDLVIEYHIDVKIYRPYVKELQKFSSKYDHIESLEQHIELKELRPDIVITLGGDGTILKAITIIKDLGIPILGINLGRLGFLASVEKKIIKKAILQLIKKDYTVVSRSILGLSSNIPLFSNFPYALNDFTLNKRDTSSMITIHTYVDDVLLNSYWADGIIISTPTGSTGYSLSCDGPIIFPDSQNFVITPVAPHNLNVRPIVLADSSKISLQVEGRTDSFMCTLDSRYETVTSDHRIEILKGHFSIYFVQLKGQSFMKTLSEKLHWGIDRRN
ncbi:MAG: NAD kinase [Saprospiraceae bacterium]